MAGLTAPAPALELKASAPQRRSALTCELAFKSNTDLNFTGARRIQFITESEQRHPFNPLKKNLSMTHGVISRSLEDCYYNQKRKY